MTMKPTWTAAFAIAGFALPAALAALPGPAAVTGGHAVPVKRPSGKTKAAAARPKAAGPAKQARAAADPAPFFETKVRPLLQTKCAVCHAGENASGKLDLTSRDAILKGGHSGPAVDLSKPAESLLLKVLHHTGAVKMPPQGKLPQPEIEALTRWVEMGMPWPAAASGGKNEPVAHHGPPAPDSPEARKFWAFQPVKRPAAPVVKNKAWARNPIDNFILARLEKSGLAPAAPVDKPALLRRVYYDLIGVPPTPDEVRAFVADKSPQAYEKVVDRLLASPHYGERWARHWLDLVRYGETNGFERDGAKPFVWRYRDYVIRSFNADKPYDVFLKEQLAGDELDTVTNETLIATGYYRLWQWDDEPADRVLAHYDELDDVVATTSQVTLGMTVNCARCHDHKIDPISQKDYFRMLAFFEGVTRYDPRRSLRSIAPPGDQKKFDAEEAAYKKRLADLDARLEETEKLAKADFEPVDFEEFKDEAKRPSLLKKRVPKLITEAQFAEYERLLKERDDLRKSPPRNLAMALTVKETGPQPPPTNVHLRGNPHVKGDPVQPGFLTVLNAPDPKIRPAKPDAKSSGRRRALAEWITNPANPLTSRVMANRLWQFHFGRGIVRSSNNFGSLGTPPTHPELLDWLASEFVKQGWRLKPMHKLMVLSSAYRMSPKPSPKALAKDPENDLLSHFDMRRLEAEEIRDSILAVNGSLNPKMFGPSIYPTIPAEVLAGQSVPGLGWGKSSPEEQARRSVYIHIKRSLTVPILASFDAADTDFSCPVRFSTTQPTQALSMLNSTFLHEQAQILADRLEKQAGPDTAAQVKLGLWHTLQRAPTAAEIARGLKLIQSLQAEPNVTKRDALRYYCVVLLNLNEFIYLD